jgi:hypothetical protein
MAHSTGFPSFKVRYASVSTTIPEHFPQTSSAPTSSRAQRSGSRRKKDEGSIGLFILATTDLNETQNERRQSGNGA